MGYTPNNNPYIPGDPYSYDLKWIVAKIKALVTQGQSVEEALESIRSELNEDDARLNIIESWIANFNTTYVKEIIAKYIATMIFVSISDSGYIIYDIPESWDDITFNTVGLDYELAGYDYGTLVLSY